MNSDNNRIKKCDLLNKKITKYTFDNQHKAHLKIIF